MAACSPHQAPARVAGRSGKRFLSPFLRSLLVFAACVDGQLFHPAGSDESNDKGPMVDGQGGVGDRVGEAGEALCAFVLESKGSSSFSFACPSLRSCAQA